MPDGRGDVGAGTEGGWATATGGSRPADTHRYVVTDVFTDTPLEGNQLAVFTDGRGLTSERMQLVAREMNLSETVFVLPAETDGDARIRIFTPAKELPFAGHPVLGSAFVVGAELGKTVVRLETGRGTVPVELERAAGGRLSFGRMDQPVPSWEPFDPQAKLLAALGVERPELPVEVYDNGVRHVFVALSSEQAVAELRPDLGVLAELGEYGVNCISGSGRRWKTRMFGPGLGVAEDPATGSAAGPLAVHCARHGLIDFGADIEIRQGAEIGRPSVLHARVEGCTDRIERVVVGGSAVVVARGDYRLG